MTGKLSKKIIFNSLVSLFCSAMFIPLGSLALSSEAYAADCIEQSLIQFKSAGTSLPSEVVGLDNPNVCDGFGGNFIHTPKFQMYLYVNFNISGTIDVDAMEKSFSNNKPSDQKIYQWLLDLKYVVVSREFIKHTYNDDREIVLNLDNSILFISEVVLEEGRFNSSMESFFSTAADSVFFY